MPDFQQMAWDIFYANLVGIQYHPGNPPDSRMPLADLALIADQMLIERNKRCPSSPHPL